MAEPEASPCAPAPEPEDTLTPVTEPAPDPVATASAEQPGSGPVAHCSQDAGENQYRDPFANSPPPKSQGGADSAQAPENTSDGSATGASTLQEDGTAAPLADDAGTGSGPGLPNTGLGLAGLVALGVPLLAGGLVLRARLA